MKLIKIIKTWLYSFRFNNSSQAWRSASLVAPEITHEDTRSKESIKRVRKAFDDQKINMNCMAFKPHEADCQIIMCDKNPCLIRIPDKKIGRSKKIVNKKSVPIRGDVK